MERDSSPEESPLLKDLGIRPAFSDEPGPPVDRAKLVRFIEGKLGPYERSEVADYTTVFRAWYEELLRVIRDRPTE
jgi:hypothetical protein